MPAGLISASAIGPRHRCGVFAPSTRMPRPASGPAPSAGVASAAPDAASRLRRLMMDMCASPVSGKLRPQSCRAEPSWSGRLRSITNLVGDMLFIDAAECAVKTGQGASPGRAALLARNKALAVGADIHAGLVQRGPVPIAFADFRAWQA